MHVVADAVCRRAVTFAGGTVAKCIPFDNCIAFPTSFPRRA
jgi:hypothetical protein